jgi:hypothetical protein
MPARRQRRRQRRLLLLMSRAARQGPRLAGVPLGQQRYIIFFISQGEPHGYIAFGIDVDVDVDTDTTTYGMGGGQPCAAADAQCK